MNNNSLQEQRMGQEVSRIEQAAAEIIITGNDTYQLAAGMLKSIKAQQKTVKDFFEPMRKTTKDAYDSVIARRKDMTAPLEKAEDELKRKMGAYQRKIEQERQEKEAELRRLAEAEREKAFSNAVAAEASGDALGAEMAMAEAEIMDDAAAIIAVQQGTPKAAGISTRTGWKITGIDPAKVPVDIAGTVIRPVDEKMVMALIKATKGQIQIPGITYEEITIISARGA